MQVKQYFNLTICPLIITSRVRGGGRYVELPVLSEGGRRERWGMFKPGAPAGEKPLLPSRDKRSLRETAFWEQATGIKCGPKAGKNIKICYQLLKLAVCQALC